MSKIDNVCTRLKLARVAAGFKRASDFCKKFDIPMATYNMHETGKRSVNSKVAQKYSGYLSINIAWLLTGVGSPYHTETHGTDTSDLSEKEYMALLTYEGNSKLGRDAHKPHSSINYIDSALFSNIVLEIAMVFQDSKIHLDPIRISKHAVEIYKDIIEAGGNQNDRNPMIKLAAIMLKKQLAESI